MSQTFSLGRFSRLFRTYFIDNRGQLVANMALLVGGLTVLSVFVYRQYPYTIESSRYGLFFMVGWAAWYIFIMQQTMFLNQKERAINYLMRPASSFEKGLLIWLVSGPCFIIVYVALFTLIDAVGISMVNSRHWTVDQLSQIRRMGGMVDLKPFFRAGRLNEIAGSGWILAVVFHSVYTALSLVIRRYALPLTAVITITLLIIGTLLNTSLLQILTGNSTISTVLPFTGTLVESPMRTGFREVTLPQPLGSQIRTVIGLTVIILLYITAYVRLKEREV